MAVVSGLSKKKFEEQLGEKIEKFPTDIYEWKTDTYGKSNYKQGKYFKKSVILLLVLSGLSSCVQLRYTDYGRPFDFLKSKNQHFVSHNSNKDTASINQTKTFTIAEENSENIILKENETISHLNPNQNQDIEKTATSVKDTPSTEKTETNSVNRKQINQTKKTISANVLSNTV